MRLHYYEREAIVDRHVTGTARNGSIIPEHLGKGSLNSELRTPSLFDSVFAHVKTENIYVHLLFLDVKKNK